MTRLSRSLLLDAKAKVRPLMNVSMGLAVPETLLLPCRATNEKLKIRSSSLLRRSRKAGGYADEEGSGSYMCHASAWARPCRR